MIVYTLLAVFLLAAQSTLPEPTAVVAGHVVDAATGRPISGVVLWAAGSAASPTPGASSPVRVMTNAAGLFVFRGLDKGSLVLTAAKGGYVNAAPGQRRPEGSGQPIKIAPGARITDVEIRMWKCASISGAVVDELGDPAVRTRVQAMRRTFVAGRARFTDGPSAQTDDRGIYRIAGLTPADYVVRVPSTQTAVPAEIMDAFFGGTPVPDATRMQLAHEMNAIGSAIAPAGSSFAMRAGGQTFSLPSGTLAPAQAGQSLLVYPTVYYPAAASLSQASIVSLRSGDERNGVDLAVGPVRGVPVSGLLMGPDGPVATTAVRLLPARDDDAIEPLEVAATMTDWTGAFRFAAVPPGQYVISVIRLPQPPPDVDGTPRVSVTPGGSMTISSAPASAPPPPPPHPADPPPISPAPKKVGDSELADVVVPLTAGPRVTGRVEFDGAIERPTADALSGLRITLDPVDGSRLAEGTLALQTGHPEAGGEFKTFGVPPGRYVLRVSPLPAGWFLRSAIFQGRDIADLPIDLDSKDAAGVIITFTDSPAAIAGSVSGPQGADATAVVIAYPADESMWTAAPRRMRTARVATDGSYAISGLPPGEYYVAAVQEDLVGEWQDPALLRGLARVAQTVRLVESERKNVNLRAATIK
jgi:hypothetical protein